MTEALTEMLVMLAAVALFFSVAPRDRCILGMAALRVDE